MTERIGPERFWERPRWWVKPGGDDSAISRKQLIGRWRAAIDLGDLDKGAFDDELAVWSSLLGEQAWVVADYGATAAELASKGVSRSHADVEGWQAVSRLWHDYGEGLARYTLGLAAAAHARRPIAPGLLVDSIREPSRMAIRTKSVRSAIVNEARVASATTTRAFLEDPSSHYTDDLKATIHAYIHRLYDFVQKCNDPDIAEAVSATIDELKEEFGEPVAEPGREISRAALQKARELLQAELDRKPHLLAAHRNDGVIGLAAAKAVEFLARKIDAGKENVTHAGIIHLTINQVVADQGRSEARDRVRLASLEMILDDPYRRKSAETVGQGPQSDTEHAVEVRLIVDMIRREVAKAVYLRRNLDGSVTPVTDFWEKDVALAILDRKTRLARESETDRVVKLFGALVSTDIASEQNAVCFDTTSSAAYVEGMIRTALTRVATAEDLPAVFVSQNVDGTRRRAKRLVAAKNLLNNAKRPATGGAH